MLEMKRAIDEAAPECPVVKQRPKSVYDESVAYTLYKPFTVHSLRPLSIRCISSIFFNFFYRQYQAVRLAGLVPVSKVDHPLDKRIPFVPSWVTIYLDFITFWVRMLGFLLRRFGHRAYPYVGDFLVSMGKLYAFAAETYRKNFSTTKRPFYIARPRFFLIHFVDPHLMCVPSLHVMVVIRTWTKFAAMLRSLGEAENYAAQIEEMKQGALAITQAILFVKQHSVNCIPAALYAMTCFDAELFPPEEAEAFAAMLFGPPPPFPSTGKLPRNYRVRPFASPRTALPADDVIEIKAHIISLYRRFLADKRTAGSAQTGQNWEKPLLNFLRQMPIK
jgi:hypothetical protein